MTSVDEIDAQTAPDDLLAELYVAETEGRAELSAGAPPPELQHVIGYYRHPSGAKPVIFLARNDGIAVGCAFIRIYGPSFTYLELSVKPAFRRRGVGSALLERILEAAREAGVRSLFGHHATEAGAAFAAHHGAHDDQRDVRAVLDLRSANLPEPTLPDGIELRSWIGMSPGELLESYVQARRSMDDAPTPGGVESPEWTIERQLDLERATIARERPARVTVALDGDRVLAFTDLRVSPTPARVALTDDTATVPAARGRGLARAVKLESLRLLRAERPELEAVVTMNAEQNEAMRHINSSLGFVPAVVLTTTVLTLQESR